MVTFIFLYFLVLNLVGFFIRSSEEINANKVVISIWGGAIGVSAQQLIQQKSNRSLSVSMVGLVVWNVILIITAFSNDTFHRFLDTFFYSLLIFSIPLLLANGLSYFMVYRLQDGRDILASRWQISNQTLMFVALLGGSLGVWLGLKLYPQYPRDSYFRFGLPVFMIVQIFLLYTLGELIQTTQT